MRKFYFSPVLLMVCNSVLAQSLHVVQTKFIGGNGYDVCNAALHDKRDNSIVFTGYTEDSCGTGNLPPCPAIHGGRDLLVGKLDSNQNLLWLKQYGGSGNEAAGGVITTVDGGYAVIGGSASYNGNVTGNHPGGGSDVWMLKLDKMGSLEWQKCYGSNYQEGASNFAQTKDKGFIIIGGSTGSGGDVPFQYVNSQFTTDWFVIKTDSIGNIQWTKTIGGTKDENGANIFEVNNHYYITGFSSSRDHECDDTSWCGNIDTRFDYFLICLDSAGNYEWNRSYGGSNSDALDDALFDDRDSTFVIVGYTNSIDHMVPSGSLPRQDIWILKTDLNGNIVWSEVYGDNSTEGHSHINKSPINKGYIISCRADLNTPIPPYYYNQTFNIHLFLIDSAGECITDKVVGGNNADINGIAFFEGNDVIVTGTTISSKFGEGISLPGPLNQNVFISKMSYWSVGLDNTSLKSQKQLQIYPNPTQRNFTIAFPEGMKNGKLRVVDASGREVYYKKIKGASDKYSISCSDWAKGVYMIIWELDDDTITQKLIVQ